MDFISEQGKIKGISSVLWKYLRKEDGSGLQRDLCSRIEIKHCCRQSLPLHQWWNQQKISAAELNLNPKMTVVDGEDSG